MTSVFQPTSAWRALVLPLAAALGLAACGDSTSIQSSDSTATDGRITSLSYQAQPNASYTVATTVSGTVVITLPSSLDVGDTVSVHGESNNPWQIAQNPGQSISTVGLPGNSIPGDNWTARDAARNWLGTASSADGTSMAAIENYGRIYLSADGGATWQPRADAQAWTCVAMSADGGTLLASASGSGLYVSTDAGATWTLRDGSALDWSGCALSSDGTRMAAVAENGRIYTSGDTGQTWSAHETVRNWKAIASSADGAQLTAVAFGDRIYTSTDAGATWTPRETNRNWERVASSADGSRLAAGDQAGYLYVSTDSGATWTPRFQPAVYTGIASSADGLTLALAVPSNAPWNAGQIYISTDGGATWVARGADRSWKSIAMSADGNRLLAAEYGGQLYTSAGNRTSTGVLGSISGGQHDYLELVYLGNGQFSVSHYTGGPFVIR